jgi:hypothetical protein
MEFDWGVCTTAREDRLSELADYRNIKGHCNVPFNYSKNPKLGIWVAKQRSHYRLHHEGKKSQITPARIQKLENLGFEWKRSPATGRGCQRNQILTMTRRVFARGS